MKINSKWVKDENPRTKNVKLLEENVREEFHIILFDHIFLDMTLMTLAAKEKIR
jgi:hypothetical protein